jgi:hypothetical protein
LLLQGCVSDGTIRGRPAVEPDDLERFLVQHGPIYLDMGFSQFALGFDGPGWNVDAGLPWLEWREERNATLAESGDAVSGASQ